MQPIFLGCQRGNGQTRSEYFKQPFFKQNYQVRDFVDFVNTLLILMRVMTSSNLGGVNPTLLFESRRLYKYDVMSWAGAIAIGLVPRKEGVALLRRAMNERHSFHSTSVKRLIGQSGRLSLACRHHVTIWQLSETLVSSPEKPVVSF